MPLRRNKAAIMFLGLLFPPCERDTVVGCVYTCDAATDCDSLMAGRVISQIRWWLYAVVGTQVAVGPATGSTVGPSTTLCRLVGCFALLRLLAFPRFPLPLRSFPQEEGWNFATRTTCACAMPLCMSCHFWSKTKPLTWLTFAAASFMVVAGWSRDKVAG